MKRFILPAILLLFLCSCTGAGAGTDAETVIQATASKPVAQIESTEALSPEQERQDEGRLDASQPPDMMEDQVTTPPSPLPTEDTSDEANLKKTENMQGSSEEPHISTVTADSAEASTETAEAPALTQAESVKSETAVTISIVCVDEAVLEAVAVEIEAGETVFQVLKRVTREQEIHMDFSGSDSTAYVMGINNVYEFDMGPESGWLYKVNGTTHSIGSGMYELQYGEVIEWVFTKEFSKDA